MWRRAGTCSPVTRAPLPCPHAGHHRRRPSRRTRERAALLDRCTARLDAPPRGPRLHVSRRRWGDHPRRRGQGPHRSAGDPARLDRRVDLPVARWSSAGHRPGRPRPQAVPLPRAVARAPRRRELRADDRVRGRAPAYPETGQAGPSVTRAVAGEGAGRGRPAAGADADPRRQRGVRTAQPLVRPDHDARSPRQRGGSQPCASGSAASPVPSTRSACEIDDWHRSSAAARSCPARTCSPTSTRTTRSATSRPTTSTTTCARHPGASSPPRTSGRGPGPCWPTGHCSPCSPRTTGLPRAVTSCRR